VTFDCAVNACSMENGALGKPALCCWVTTGVCRRGDAAPGGRQSRHEHGAVAIDAAGVYVGKGRPSMRSEKTARTRENCRTDYRRRDSRRK
jgi:hypothetical protein